MTPTLASALSALLALAALATASAQPPRRAHHALAYDPVGQRVLLTAGSTPLDGGQRFEFFNDLWAFDGARWSALPASGDKRSGIAIAVDTRRNRVLSFGGYAGGSLADVRALEDGAWRTVGQHAAMPAAEPGFVYDAGRDRFVAFGGSAGMGRAHGATWEYDGASWTRVETPAGPPPRQAHAMVFDARRGRTVVFGGMGSGAPGQPPPSLGDTWEFDGRAWMQANVPGPSPRASAGVAYDSKRGLVILFGGAGSDGFKGDTWSWDGRAWTKLADTGPAPRAMGYLAYDAKRDRVVLFGGRNGWPNGDQNDTWEWDGTVWRRIEG